LVLLGPLNEHIMVQENRATFRRLRDGMAGWCKANNVPYVMPETLPSALYADASHPLTEGYQLLAERLKSDAAFQKWRAGKVE